MEYKTTLVPPIFSTSPGTLNLEQVLEDEFKWGGWELVCQVSNYYIGHTQPNSRLVWKREK